MDCVYFKCFRFVLNLFFKGKKKNVYMNINTKIKTVKKSSECRLKIFRKNMLEYDLNYLHVKILHPNGLNNFCLFIAIN